MNINILTSENHVAIPPGATIREQLLTRGLTQKEFAKRMDLSEKHISKLINGNVALTHQIALRLESVLGLPASFWNNLESIFREEVERVKEENDMEKDKEMVSKFPYADMSKFGWVKKTQKKEERVKELRSFFEVARLYIIDNLTVPGIAYRRMGENQKSDYTLAAWSQKAKIEARKVDTKAINIEKLKESILQIRALTIKPPSDFCDELKTILADCGIALVFLPHIKSSFLHGASFVDGNHIVIGLTVRGKDADKFWFSLFHELGHIINGDIFSREYGQKQEKNADSYACDVLISEEALKRFIEKNNISEKSIRLFATNINISPGIVVGRLQKEGVIPFNYFNSLKEKYKISI